MAQRRAIIPYNWFWKRNFKQLSKKIFRQSLYKFLSQLTKAIVSTNNSREILACRRQVLSREQESTHVEQAKTIAKESVLEVEQEDKILAKKVGE